MTGTAARRSDNDTAPHDDASGVSDTNTRQSETYRPAWRIDTNLSDSDSSTEEDRKQPAKRQSDEFSEPGTPHINLLSPPTLDNGDNDGFIPVPVRKRVREKVKDRNLQDIIPQTVVTSFTKTNADPLIVDLLTPRHTDDSPRPSAPSPLSKSSRSEREKIKTFSEHLNDRVQEAMLVVDQRSHLMEERMRQYDTEMRKIERRQAAARDRFEERLTAREAFLNRWEAGISQQRTRDLTDLERRSVVDLSHRETDLANLARRTKDLFDEYKRQIDAITFQNELASRSWYEVEMEKFKEQLAEHQSTHKSRTDDFCEEQLQNLESNLDSYAEHARGIQEKLLVRLRKDIQQTFADTHREEEQKQRPVCVDDAHTPQGSTQHTPMADTASPADPPKTRRWGQVDYDDILQPTGDVNPPRAKTVPHNNHGEGRHQYQHEETSKSGQYSKQPTDTDSGWRLPPQHAKWADPDFQISQLRKTSTPTRLRGRDQKSVTVFYNSFVDFNKIYQVPLKILDDIRIDRLDDDRETVYPSGTYESDIALHDRYSAAIYARLEEEDVLDPAEPLYVGLLQMYNSRREGYALLKAILFTTLMVHTQDLERLSTPPTASPGTTPYEFACRLSEFYRVQQQFNRIYTVREQAMMFLQGMAQDPVYMLATQQLIHDIQQISEHVPLPTRFCNPALPLTLLAHPSALHASRQTSASINVTHATHSGRSADNSRRGSDRDRSRSQERGFDQNRSHSRERPPHSSDPSNRRSISAGRLPTSRNIELQCKACATNGHTHAYCRLFPKWSPSWTMLLRTRPTPRMHFICFGRHSIQTTDGRPGRRSLKCSKAASNKDSWVMMRIWRN